MKIYLAIGAIDNARLKVFRGCGVERVLVSFADIRSKADIKLPFPDCMMDSGAFGIGTGCQEVTVETYTLWLELYLKNYPQIQTYINLDDLKDPVKSKKNLEYMEAHELSPMPVYHYGEPTEFLNEMCSKYEYVGLGGFAIGNMPTNNLQRFWEWCYEEYSSNRFHIFGATAMGAFCKYQPYSMDSTSWNAGARYGRIPGYKNGFPSFCEFGKEDTGIELFFTNYELWNAGVKAMLDWEKLEWLEKIKESDKLQGRLF